MAQDERVRACGHFEQNLPVSRQPSLLRPYETALTVCATWQNHDREPRRSGSGQVAILLRSSLRRLISSLSAQIITAENGKPLADSRGEVTYGGKFRSLCVWLAYTEN